MTKFNQMSTKKLNTLLNDENTSAEDKTAIQEVLNTRNAASASAETPAYMTPELTPEEQAAIAAAEGEAAPKNEVVEPAKKIRSNKKTALDENGNPIPGKTAEDWSDEAIEEAVKEVIANVGKIVSYPEAGAYGEVAENAPTVSGRIVSLVPNKRQQTILYRIELDQTEEEVAAKAAKKYAHKVTTNEALVIAEELDEVGQKINESFTNRRYKESAPKVQMTPEEAYKTAEASLNKAKEALAKAQATLEKRQAAFDKAKAAFEAQGSEPSEDGGQGKDDSDLM